MTINNFTPSTFKMTSPYGGMISSEDLNLMFDSISSDFAGLQSLLNDNIVKLLSTLPSTLNPTTDSLDGSNIAVDSNAVSTKDWGIFFDTATGKPRSIYDSLLLVFQLVANINNGTKEGVKIGTEASQISVGPTSGDYTIAWPYSDKMFNDMLYEKVTGETLHASGLTVKIDVSSNIVISSPSDKTIWGIVWHPILSL